MIQDSRKAMLFGVGLLVGVAAGAVGMLSLRGGDGPYASMPASTRAAGAGASSTAFLTAVAGNCELSPMLSSAGDGDGRERLQDKPDAASADEVASLILSGKEAAASGRQRDAEVAFLNACRNAAALPQGDVAPLADAMYQLARHYANAAAFGAPKSKELFQRAERLYSASLEGFRAGYGEEHEKTRFAREGLVTVQHATGGKAPSAIARSAPPPAAPQPVAVAAPAPAAPAEPAPAAAAAPAPAAKAPVAKAPAPAAPAPAPAAATTPAPSTPSTSTASTDPRPAPASSRTTRAPRDEATSTPSASADTAEPQRPRTTTRRSAPREDSAPDSADTALDTPPAPAAPTRRLRPVPMETAEPAAPDTSASGGPATASGSVGDVSSGDAAPTPP